MRAALISLLALAGCVQVDPYTRTGMWQPGGVNSRNLAAMVANPHDLLQGRGSTGAQGVTATAAVERLLAGVPTPLPSVSAAAAPGSGAGNVAAGPAPAPPAGPAAPAAAAN
jgi:hypothetical protein